MEKKKVEHIFLTVFLKKTPKMWENKCRMYKTLASIPNQVFQKAQLKIVKRWYQYVTVKYMSL